MIRITKHAIGMLIGMTILTHGNLQATQKSIVEMVVDSFYRHTDLKAHMPPEFIKLICKYTGCRLCNAYKEVKSEVLTKVDGKIKKVLCYKEHQYLLIVEDSISTPQVFLYNSCNNKKQAINIDSLYEALLSKYNITVHPCQPEPLLILVTPHKVYSLTLHNNTLKKQQSLMPDTGKFNIWKKPFFSAVYNGLILFKRSGNMLLWPKNNDTNMQQYFKRSLENSILMPKLTIPCLQSINKNEEYLYHLDTVDPSRENYITKGCFCITCINMKTNNSSTLFKALSYTGLKHLSISPNKRRLAVVKFYTKNKEVMYDTLCKWDISNPEFPKRIFKMAIKADPYKIVPTGCNDFICVYKQHICGPNGTILHKLKDDNEVYTYVGDNRLTKTMGLCTLLVAVYNKATNRSSLDVL